MSAYAQMLTEKRANVWEQAMALLDRAAGEKRELTPEETEQYERMTADLAEMRQAVDKLTKSEQDSQATEEALRALAASGVDETRKATDPAPSIAEQFRAVARGEKRELFIKPTTGDLAGIQARNLGKGTAAAGAATVPTTFYAKLWAHLIQTANLMNAGATILTTDGGENIQIPATTAHSSATLVPGGSAIPQSDPAFVQRQLGAYKYGVLILVDRELIDDTGVDLEGYLAMQAGRAVGNALGTDLIVGNGASKPTGILNNTTLGVTGSTGVTGAFNFDNLIDLYYSVIPQYRQSSAAGWLMNDTSVGIARKLKDGQGRYLWEPSLTAGSPDQMLNKPVYTDPNVPGTAVSAKSVAFGDISAYFVRIVNGVRFERSVDYAFNTDQVAFRCLIRGDGVLVDQTGAVKHFSGAAT